MNETEQLNNFLRCFLEINNPTVSNLSTHSDHSEYEHDHHHEEDYGDYNGSSRNYDLLLAKGIAMVVLFCASTLCGSLPSLLDRYLCWMTNQTNTRSAMLVKCLLYFGGGVLLATTFLHLVPEVQELVQRLKDCSVLPHLTFSLAELLMCCGFFLMYFIEEAIHAYIHLTQSQDKGAAVAFKRGHSIRNSRLVMRTTVSSADDTNSTFASPQTTTTTLSVQHLLHIDLENHKYNDVSSNFKDQQERSRHHQSHSHPHNQIHLSLSNDAVNPSANIGDFLASSLRGLVIVLALSLHELFEGMAIGLESSASSVWFMFGAVSAHKLVLAFCVGVELIVAGTRRAFSIVYILTFAIVSPLGIGIGLLISHNQDNTGTGLVSVILQGLACGTLLYVVFFEILSKNRAGLRAYLALFMGFIIMFGLQQLGASNGHGHSHDYKCTTTKDDYHHDRDEPSDIRTLKSRKDENYEQQLQILRQVTKQLLDNHH